MTDESKSLRYIHQTRGVCPPEIHFRIKKGTLQSVHFVGGGCPGNAELVTRLLKGRPLEEVLQLLGGIECRNNTSCPDQLATALKAAQDGSLGPAHSFRIYNDPLPRHRIGLIGELSGGSRPFESLIAKTAAEKVDAVYYLGNLTGSASEDNQLMRMVRKHNILAIQGDRDSRYVASAETGAGCGSIDQNISDWLQRLPHVLSFRMAKKTGMAFFGEYIQNLPGYSDFELYALEMNMVSGLTNFMQDETVFPALEAMIPQFRADIILFSQVNRWGHWHIAGKDFISLGPAVQAGNLSWGLLEVDDDRVRFKRMQTEVSQGG
jgi:uncharacterized protein (TIGR03905 family)